MYSQEDLTDLGLGQSAIEDLVELYITNIHDKPHSLFHAPTLRRDVSERTIDSALLYCILAFASRFSDDGYVRDLGSRLEERAKWQMQMQLEEISITKVQCWVLLGNLCGLVSNYASESLFFGIAIRMSNIMGLERSISEESPVLSEVKSRVRWTLYMIDRWSAAGLGTPRQIQDRTEAERLPLDEYSFHSMAPDSNAWPSPGLKPGLWAYMVTLVEIFGPIQDLNRMVAMRATEDLDYLDTVADLSGRLQSWLDQLPCDKRLDASTLRSHKSLGQGRTFVALHLGFYHYATLLYFQFLDQQATADFQVQAYATRCREYASAFSDLLRTSYEIGECEAMYNIVGHMCVVSSSVLLHTLLFGDESQSSGARSRLESNFTILMKLKAWWSTTEDMIDRLFVFQNECFRAADHHTHKVDKWMVKFLLEHGSKVLEKSDVELIEVPSPMSNSPETQRLSARGKLARHALYSLRA